MPAHPPADPSDVPVPLAPPLPDNFDVLFRASLTEEARRAWFLDADPPLRAPTRAEVEFPDATFDYAAVGAAIELEFAKALADGTLVVDDDNTVVLPIYDAEVLHQLRASDVTVEGEPADYVIATDGSGTGEAGGMHGPGGFAALIIRDGGLAAIFGAATFTTSGEMEMTAVLAALRHVKPPTDAPWRIACISDYESFVVAEIEVLRARGPSYTWNTRCLGA